jgi:hypothetical protein
MRNRGADVPTDADEDWSSPLARAIHFTRLTADTGALPPHPVSFSFGFFDSESFHFIIRIRLRQTKQANPYVNADHISTSHTDSTCSLWKMNKIWGRVCPSKRFISETTTYVFVQFRAEKTVYAKSYGFKFFRKFIAIRGETTVFRCLWAAMIPQTAGISFGFESAVRISYSRSIICLFIFGSLTTIRSWDSSVGILMGYGLDGPGSSPGRVKNFLFSVLYRPVLGLTEPAVQWVPGALSRRVKRQGREGDHWPSSATVKKGGAIPPLSHMPSCIVLN